VALYNGEPVGGRARTRLDSSGSSDHILFERFLGVLDAHGFLGASGSTVDAGSCLRRVASLMYQKRCGQYRNSTIQQYTQYVYNIIEAFEKEYALICLI
jgi:hypothetical protein